MKTVHIELQRVQTWLFAVPRLRAMVGANTLLGEILRIELRNLATRTDQGWKLAPLVGDYPPADPNDPLPKLDGKDADNPAEDAKDGILSRDGGHFEAQFTEGAELFARAASDTLRAKLPDLRFQVSILLIPGFLCSRGVFESRLPDQIFTHPGMIKVPGRVIRSDGTYRTRPRYPSCKPNTTYRGTVGQTAHSRGDR